MANLQDGFFVRTIDELDPATGIANDDGFVVEQGGTARRATLEQVQAGFTTTATFTGHTGDTANPHATTAAQVGALTTAQTNAAIASATNTVNTALTTHTGNTANPHATTAAQVGAFTTAQTTSAINAAAATVNTALTTHVNNVSNPHGVTADQVGRTLNQWNANQIQYRPINIPFPAPDGAVLIYDSPTNAFTLAEITAELIGAVDVDSPAFTGTPTAPTQPFATSTTRLANMAAITANATTHFSYAERSAAVALASDALTSFSTNWTLRHGASNFTGADWFCPRTGWYDFSYRVKIARVSGGTFFDRVFGDLLATDTTREELFDFSPGQNSAGGLSGTVSGTVPLYFTQGLGYRLRIFARHNATVQFDSGFVSYRWAGLNGLGA
jgi:hypothetical protein